MDSLKALFKRGTDAHEYDERSAEMKLQTKAWQHIYSEIICACDESIQASASKKKHKAYPLPAEPLYLDLVRPALSGAVIAFDHSNLISRATGEITDFKTWHRCSFVVNDNIL